MFTHVMAQYSAVALEHFSAPRNFGPLDDYDFEGEARLPGQSAFLRLHLHVEGTIIKRAGFMTFGCAAAIAAGSFLTEMIKDREVSDCLQISAEDLDRSLGGLPEERRFCANLAVGALQNAIKQALSGL